MDESGLQDRLDRIRRRQYLILVLLVVPYPVFAAEFLGFWKAGVLSTVVGLVVLATVVFYRRRNRDAAGQ